MDKLFFLTNIFEIITAILAVIYFNKYSTSSEKYFFYFLWITVFVELVGFFLKTFLGKNIIFWIYNLFVFFSFVFYFYWYLTILKKEINKKIIIGFTCVFILVTIIEFYNFESGYYLIYTFLVGSVITIIGSLLFYSELLNSNKALNIKHDLRFWIATGLLLFNVGMAPFIFFANHFTVDDTIPAMIILISLNFILYSCYSLGFIWLKKK